MSDEAKCCKCETPVSYETGFTLSGTLAEGSEHRVYCPECAPNQGKGYTLADLEQWKRDTQVDRDRYQMAKMEQLGPDVYFHVLGPTFPPEDTPS